MSDPLCTAAEIHHELWIMDYGLILLGSSTSSTRIIRALFEPILQCGGLLSVQALRPYGPIIQDAPADKQSAPSNRLRSDLSRRHQVLKQQPFPSQGPAHLPAHQYHNHQRTVIGYRNASAKQISWKRAKRSGRASKQHLRALAKRPIC